MKTVSPENSSDSDASVVETTTQVDPRAWQEYLSRQTCDTFHHRLDWDHVVATYGLRTERIVARRGGQVVGVLPLIRQRSWLFGDRLVSLPWVDAAGVIADDEEAETELLNGALDLARGLGGAQVQIRQATALRSWDAPRTDKVDMRLALPDQWESLWSSFHPKVRNQIRKAEKSGLHHNCARDADFLGDFFHVYTRNMRDLGSPSHSRRFLDAVRHSFGDCCTIHVVALSDEVIGAAFTMDEGSYLSVPWASSLRKYNSLCVNHFLYWNILKQACEAGCREFRFGRSTEGSGTFRFKKQWGAPRVPLYWYSRTAAGEPFGESERPEESFGMARRMWRRLPVWLSRRLGPQIISRVA